MAVQPGSSDDDDHANLKRLNAAVLLKWQMEDDMDLAIALSLSLCDGKPVTKSNDPSLNTTAKKNAMPVADDASSDTVTSSATATSGCCRVVATTTSTVVGTSTTTATNTTAMSVPLYNSEDSSGEEESSGEGDCTEDSTGSSDGENFIYSSNSEDEDGSTDESAPWVKIINLLFEAEDDECNDKSAVSIYMEALEVIATANPPLLSLCWSVNLPTYFYARTYKQ